MASLFNFFLLLVLLVLPIENTVIAFQSGYDELIDRSTQDRGKTYGPFPTSEHAAETKNPALHSNKSLVARVYRQPYKTFTECRDIGKCILPELYQGLMVQDTRFTKISDLLMYQDGQISYGWENLPVRNERLSAWGNWQLFCRYEHCNVGDFVCVWSRYSQWWMDDGPYVAGYKAWFDRISGIIIVENAIAPIDPLIPDLGPDQQIPDPLPLRRLSDWLFIVWSDICAYDATCIQSLRRVVHAYIWNESTMDVAKRAVSSRFPPGTTNLLRIRPGVFFKEPTANGVAKDNFDAVMGSPNGVGVAFLLGQHTRVFGNKVVDGFTIFGDGVTAWPSIGWRITPFTGYFNPPAPDQPGPY